MNLSYYQPGMIKGFIARDPVTKAEWFVERKEASHIAYLTGQILGDYGTLYSCSYKYLSND